MHELYFNTHLSLYYYVKSVHRSRGKMIIREVPRRGKNKMGISTRLLVATLQQIRTFIRRANFEEALKVRRV